MAVRVWVSPTVIVKLVLFKLTPVTDTICACTVTVHVAFFPPSFVVTVIVAEPVAFAVTTPEDDTVATEVLFEDQVTDLLVALEGVTVATKDCVSPTVMVKLVLSRLTPVTAIVLALTVTAQVAVLEPSDVFTVIVVEPAVFAATTPAEETDATDELLDVHVTDLLVASDGVTVAINSWTSPSVKVKLVLSRLTPVTEITFAFTVTAQDAVLFPSLVFTVISAVPSATASTRPLLETVATEDALVVHVTSFTEAFDGLTEYDNVVLSPSVKVNSVGVSETDSTAMYLPFFPS